MQDGTALYTLHKNLDSRAKPPLKWAGGKRWLVPHLLPMWQRHIHRRLVEPLCGGLAVTLGLMPEKALLNDINPHVINFFKWLKTGLIIDIPMENNKELYYKHREEFNQLIERGDVQTKRPQNFSTT
jgi:Site-specific DNA methylase